jgi:hypothetical protein
MPEDKCPICNGMEVIAYSEPSIHGGNSVYHKPCKCLLDRHYLDFLKRSLIPDRYAKAILGDLSPKILAELPKFWHDAVKDSIIDGYKGKKHGLCISGDAPVGKSMAIGVYLKAIFRKLADAEKLPRDPFYQHVWLDWQDIYEWYQSNAINEEVTNRFEKYANCALLIIDGLGSERFKEDSFAHGQLNRIINARYSQNRAIIITTQLNKEELNIKYGKSLVNRMLYESNLVEV